MVDLAVEESWKWVYDRSNRGFHRLSLKPTSCRAGFQQHVDVGVESRRAHLASAGGAQLNRWAHGMLDSSHGMIVECPRRGS